MFNIVKDLIEEYIQDEVSTNSMEICLVVHLNRVRNWNVILLTEETKEEEAHKLELKPFPEEFEYVCLGDQQTFPTIISSQITSDQESKLLTILKSTNLHLVRPSWT